jgi:hypothetical protein
MDALSIIALFAGVMGLTLSIGMARAYTKLVMHLREKKMLLIKNLMMD